MSDKEVFKLDVEGMSCSGCVESVKNALEQSEGVQRADVSLDEKQAVIYGNGVDRDQAIAAIEQAGFKAAAQNG